MYTLFAQSVFLKTNSSLHKTHRISRITSDVKKSIRKEKKKRSAVLSNSILTLLKFNDDYKKCLKITVDAKKQELVRHIGGHSVKNHKITVHGLELSLSFGAYVNYHI